MKTSLYFYPLLLLTATILGGFVGYFLGPSSLYLKPFGDLFLNLIFTALIPLIFFSVTAAVARLGSALRVGKMILAMLFIFLTTSLIAALYAFVVVLIFPLSKGLHLALPHVKNTMAASPDLLKPMMSMMSVSHFYELLSQEHIIALIVFSLLLGLAVIRVKEPKILIFLQTGEKVCMQIFSLIMYYAPVGFFAYFAVLVHEIGPQIMHHYLRITLLFYLSSIIYYFFAFSLYTFLAGKTKAVKLFWRYQFLPAITALATCSSAASIPANLAATKKMKVRAEISDAVVPLGSIIHKEGSVIGGMFKIAFLFALFHLDFSSLHVIFTALFVSVLVGTVMGAIPSGGMLGEILIINFYGFDPSVLIAIAAISIIIDPIATVINVMGNSVSAILVTRLFAGKKWCLPRNNHETFSKNL